MCPATPIRATEKAMISRTLTIYDPMQPTINDLTLFLARYSAILLGSGATCMRLEKNVGRIAGAYDKEAELTITPRHINISVYKPGKTDVITAIASVARTPISFDVNTRLSKLSWAIADHKVDFTEARRQLEACQHPREQSKWELTTIVAFANASFCSLFGGDWIAMGVVWMATFAGYYMKLLLASRGVDARAVWLICSFISAVLGATDRLFALGTTPEIALGTSVLYLVPGIPFINSFSDVLYRHYICAFSRFCDAAVLTACLSIGLCAGMLLMNAGMF